MACNKLLAYAMTKLVHAITKNVNESQVSILVHMHLMHNRWRSALQSYPAQGLKRNKRISTLKHTHGLTELMLVNTVRNKVILPKNALGFYVLIPDKKRDSHYHCMCTHFGELLHNHIISFMIAYLQWLLHSYSCFAFILPSKLDPVML